MHDGRLGRVGTQAALVAVGAVVVAGCSTPPNGSPIQGYGQPRARVIVVGVEGCDGTAELAEVHETPTTVEVRVTGGGGVPGGDACAESLEVELDEPLGDRQVVDLSTGALVEREG